MQTKRIHFPVPVSAVLAAGLLALTVPALPAEEPDHGAMDHSMMGHDMTQDAEGRTLHDMKHEMDPALIKELRQHVSVFKNRTDAEITMAMDAMGPNYAWYISPPDLKGPQGVLILMHGFGDIGDKIFKKNVAPIGETFPTSMGIGMAMMMSMHIQVALDELKRAGAKEIAVLPVVSTDRNELYRQWLYILGRDDKPEYSSVPRVKTDADLRIVPPPGDDGLIGEILVDYANELSTDPKNEVVIIAGHGPTNPEDNAAEMKILANLAKMVKEDGGFAAAYGQTLQDDAPTAIRAANVQKLRGMVENATKNGQQALIVTNLIGARTIQAKLRNDLKGLDYKFNAKGIVQHPNFLKWMMTGIHYAFENKQPAA